jgi:hypothetical protein
MTNEVFKILNLNILKVKHIKVYDCDIIKFLGFHSNYNENTNAKPSTSTPNEKSQKHFDV